jgi:hypothetical protein
MAAFNFCEHVLSTPSGQPKIKGFEGKYLSISHFTWHIHMTIWRKPHPNGVAEHALPAILGDDSLIRKRQFTDSATTSINSVPMPDATTRQ